MGFMNGLLMGIGAAGTTYGENRIHDQREAIRQQAELEKEKRIEEASIRAEGRAVAGKKAERESELAFNTDPEHVAAVANAKLAGQKVTDAYDDSRFPTKLDQEGRLAHAKHIETTESPSLAALHNAQADYYRNAKGKGSSGDDENGWSKSDTGILHANNSLRDTFSKELKSYDEAIDNATNEEEKIALQAKRAETEIRLNKVIASTQSLVDKYMPTSGNPVQTEESYATQADPSGLRTKKAYDTITEMTKDGSIEPPAVQDMSLSDMQKWISEHSKGGVAKQQESQPVKEVNQEPSPATNEKGKEGLLLDRKKRRYIKDDVISNITDSHDESILNTAKYYVKHGVPETGHSDDRSRLAANDIQVILNNKSLSEDDKANAIADVLQKQGKGTGILNQATRWLKSNI